jgi:hypothetical protein
VLTEEQRHELMRINREWLLANPPPAIEADAQAQSIASESPA